MRIRKLEIDHFGKLNNYVLEPEAGLNFIYGRNEDGKSTIMAFIRMMFYGNVGVARDVALNARKKYRPWSGEAMGGAIEFEHDGSNYRLQKRFGQTAGRDEVSLFNLDTGDAVALNHDEEVGMHFFGMTLDGFERSMFIGRSGAVESRDQKSDGITEKLINLTTSNDENVSLKETLANITKAMEKLRSKRGSSGLLPEAEERVEELERELREARAEEAAKRSTREELETLLTLQATEKEKLTNVREQRKNLSNLAEEIDAKKEKLALSERRTELYRAEKDKRDELAKLNVKQAEEKLEQAREAAVEEKEINLIPLFAVLAVVALALAITLAVLFNPLYALIALAIPVFMLGEMSAVSRKRRMASYRKAAGQRAEKLEEELEDLLEKTGREAEADEKNLKRLETEEKDAATSLKRANLRHLELSKLLESDDGLEDKIIDREAKIAEIKSRLADTGRPISVIIDEREVARETLEAYKEKYEALKVAAEALERAGEELRRNFGPRLNARTAEIFSGLTGGKYTNVNVSKEFGIRVLENGDTYYRDGGFLSNGTVDQAYFALRLAIAEILTEAEGEMLPLLLDDIFEQYDDKRAEEGLRFLKQYSEEKGGQVLLFSCHGRVLDMAEEVAPAAGFMRLSEGSDKK